MTLGAEIWGKAAAELAITRTAQVAVPWFKRAYYRLHKRRVVVLGMPGSGKTVLTQHLSENDIGFRFGHPDPGQSVAAETRRHELPGLYLETIVVPGQQSGTRGDELQRWSSRRVHGVVHVMANGYRTRRDSTASAYDLARAKDVEEYLERQRELEVEAFRQDFQFYRDLFRAHHTKWILVAVTKADLYWDRIAAVRDYYVSGSTSFGRAKAELEGLLGSDNVTVHVVPVSCTLDELIVGEQVLRPMISERQRDGLLADFWRVLRQLGGVR